MKKEKLVVNFKKQNMTVNLMDKEISFVITCSQGYHLWNLLDNVFKEKSVVDKLKIYNKSGEIIKI